MIGREISFACVAIGACIALSAPASAEVLKMKVDMTSAQEVPPNPSAGKGTTDVTFDTASKLLTWKTTYSGLTGPATMAHFHGPAEPGKNAPVIVPFKDASSGAEGSATLTDEQAKELIDGKVYVNVHTADNKGGEIRGQVTK